MVLVPAGPLRLLTALEGEEVLVAVGEVELGARPGTVHVLDWQEVPFGGDGGARNGHALRITMEAARMRSEARAPRRALLVGIEGRGPIGSAGTMHVEVAGALAGAARVVLDLANGLSRSDETEVTRARRASPMPPGPRAAAR